MARFEKGKGKKKSAWQINEYGAVLRAHELPTVGGRLPGYRHCRDAARAHAEARRLASGLLAKGYLPADPAANQLAAELPALAANAGQTPQLPLRQDIYVYNEATGFCVTSAKMAGKGIDSGEAKWDKAVLAGKLLPVSLIQDDPFVIRIVVGDGLTAQEQEEWVGRIDWHLDLADGQLVVCGGAEYLLDGYEDGDDYAGQFVRKLAVPPGHYRASVYFQLNGINGQACLDGLAGGYGRMEPPGQWFRRSRPESIFPAWLRHWCIAYPDADPGHEAEWQGLPYPDSETGYVDFLLHLQPDPSPAETKKRLGKPATEGGWFAETANARKPEHCPLGLKAQDVIGHEPERPVGEWIYLFDVAARCAGTDLQPLPDPLALPLPRIADLFMLAWFAQPSTRPEFRLRLPDGDEPGAGFAWPEQTVAWPSDGVWHIGFGDLYGQGLFDALAALAPLLAALPVGTELELLCSQAQDGDDGPLPGLQRYQGTLAAGQWWLAASYPAADAQAISAALQLAAECQDGKRLRVQDEAEAEAILARLNTQYDPYFFEDNPPHYANLALQLKTAEVGMLRLVAAAAFTVRYRHVWPVTR